MLLFMDSFDHYATADLSEKWTGTTVSGGTLTVAAGAGRRGTAALRATGPIVSASCIANKTLTPADPTTVIAGFSFVASATPPATRGIGIFRVQDGGTTQCTLAIRPDFRCEIRTGGVTGTPVVTSSVALNAGVVVYLEVRMVIHNTAGAAQVRINGVEVINATGINTRASAANQWTTAQFGISTTTAESMAGTADYDDLYVLDGSGAAPWNTFLGDCRVDVRRPIAAGATTGWTPLAGANWQAVDDAAPDDDATYTAATAVGLTDTFVVEDAPVAGVPVYGVQVNVTMKKTDSGTCSVAPVIRHGGTDQIGAAIAPGTAYANGRAVYATNPGTSTAWTTTEFNAAEFGYRRVA